MSLDKFTKLANSLAERIENNEPIVAGFLANKLIKAAELHPYDTTIVSLASVISKYADKNSFITRGEVRDLYNRFYVRSTKFAELFEEELGGTVKLATPKYASNDSQVPVSTNHLGDQVLANALEGALNRENNLRTYDISVANKATKVVSETLDSWGLGTSRVSVDAGNEKSIVVKASYDTPKGATHFYVPVEILGTKVAAPNVFVSNLGAEDLNYNNVKKYLTSFAGEKLKVTADAILDVITKAASENREISDVELAIARLNASRSGQQEYFANQILNQKVAEEPIKEVQLPKYSEFSHFEKQFTTPYGIASTVFGEQTVTIARDSIVRTLGSFGFKQAQVSVSDSNDNTVFYAVALDSGRIGFTVPVKIQNGKVQTPSIILCKGAASSFDSKTIKTLYANNITDYNAATIASPHYGLKSSELIDSIRQSMKEKNFAKAEDALNVLASSGDDLAYANGFKIYASNLGEQAVDGDDITNHPLYNANDFYTTAASSLPISKQTGLPINKIYIDNNGNHRPLYRRGMSETYNGGFFMNYKIFG